MSHIDELESQSIYLMREAFHSFERPAMLWSMGKDSNVLVWLAKKAFCGHMPFPVVHIDTTYEFPEMLEFRAWAKEHYGFDLTVWINQEARARGIGYETTDPVTVTHELKTVALQQCLAAQQLRRADHRHPPRRGLDARQGALFLAPQRGLRMGLQGPAARILEPFHDRGRAPGEHVRVQPLLDWTETRHLALPRAREGAASRDVLFAQGKALPLARLHADHQARRRATRRRSTKSSRS